MEQDSLIQYLNPQGQLTPSGEHFWRHLSTDMRLSLYRWMVFIRTYDQQCFAWQKQGKVLTYPPFSGQEATQAGSVLALEKADWLFPTYRDTGASLVKGLPVVSTLLYWKGRIEKDKVAAELSVLPPAIPIATHLLHAVGVAWASKIRGGTNVAFSLFGEGATSEGDFHEACNFASVMKVPVIFFCQNNGYAISTPFHKQSSTHTVVEKAQSYALPSYRVDGNDILAVYDITHQAVQRARDGKGATLIEAITYRLGPHTTADDPSKYRSASEERDWQEKDPLQRYKKLLIDQCEITEDTCSQYVKESKNSIRSALQQAESLPPVCQTQLFTHVFDELPIQLQRQQTEATKGCK